MPELVDCSLPQRTESFVSGSSIRTKKLILPDANIQNFQSGIRRLSLKCLPESVRKYVEEQVKICCPEEVHVCDGSEKENCRLLEKLKKSETIVPLPKYTNCWLAKTDPKDVARVESKTFICTPEKSQAIPEPKSGVKGTLGHWISPEDMEKAVDERFPGCMKDKTMYVIPFSMGPIGSKFSKIGLQITDSPYVVTAMRIMTRMGTDVVEHLQEHKDETVVKCLHSVGQKSNPDHPGWPCDPERTIILHKPLCNEIVSYGSGYGGNSLLGKKCLALRLGSWMARKEGWLAEHMLILGITPPCGEKKYIAAAFPSACGKTNLALMTPSLPGYKIECVGDDIAWLRYNCRTKMLHAVNPEFGFFGVAPGTSNSTNPNAMATMQENSMFTNVASTSDGGVWWEGLEDVAKGVGITDWLGKPWTKDSKTPAAHPNSRFCCPASQCPIIDPKWEDPEGVPISAILFGGRRPNGVPLVYEAYNWRHGVFVGSSMRSEATAAAEHKGKQVMHDPFAMRPFFGYNFGEYLEHWLSMEETEGIKLPKVFHVNWFRKDNEGKFLWPGYGENIRVLDWVLKRVNEKEDTAQETPIGYVPADGSMNLEGLKGVNMKELLSVPKEFWNNETEEISKYYSEQLPNDLPDEIKKQLKELKNRLCSN